MSIYELKKPLTIQHDFFINVLETVEKEKTDINIIKGIYDKLISNIILNGDKFKTTH